MEEKVGPSQHVTTHTHTHTHQPVTVLLLQCVMCYTTFLLIPRPQPRGQQIMFCEAAANKVLKTAAVLL